VQPRGAVAEQFGAVAEECDGEPAAGAAQASWRIQAIGPSAYSKAPIEPEVSMISATWGASIGARTLRTTRQGCVEAGRPVACWA
jgi:hypothetical protein